MWNMTLNNVPTYFEKEVKAIHKIIWAKYSSESSYTIPKGPLEKRCGEQAKIKINGSQFRVTFVL
jgi:hypothetical protein